MRPLRDNDLVALPWSTIVGDSSSLIFRLVDKPMFAGTESLAEGWAEGILIDMCAAAKNLLGRQRRRTGRPVSALATAVE